MKTLGVFQVYPFPLVPDASTSEDLTVVQYICPTKVIQTVRKLYLNVGVMEAYIRGGKSDGLKAEFS